MNKKTALTWIALVSIPVAILFAVRWLSIDDLQSTFQHWLRGLGFWGPVVFLVIYVAATICMIPGSILTLAAGAIFGLPIGFAVVSIASTVGAALAFLIARYFARGKVEAVAKSNTKFQAVDDAITAGGWKVVGLLRLSPAIPFNWQNYLYGVTNIKFWPYVLTSWIAMMPGTFMYVYLGNVAGAATTGRRRTPVEWAFLIVGLLATIVVTVYVARLAKQQLIDKTKL